MFPLILAAIAILAGMFFIGWGSSRIDTRALAKGLKWVAIGLGVIAVGFMAVTGRLGAAVGILAALGPFLLNWRALRNRAKAAMGPSPGQRSTIRTATLSMHLDHDTGELDGHVLHGPYAGRDMGELSVGELIDLMEICERRDPESLPLIEAWLDRHHEGWRTSHDQQDRAHQSEDMGRNGARAMTREEALDILGLPEGADDDAVREAHRRLMKKLHPDQGGSTWLAARINQAKDYLLGR